MARGHDNFSHVTQRLPISLSYGNSKTNQHYVINIQKQRGTEENTKRSRVRDNVKRLTCRKLPVLEISVKLILNYFNTAVRC